MCVTDPAEILQPPAALPAGEIAPSRVADFGPRCVIRAVVVGGR